MFKLSLRDRRTGSIVEPDFETDADGRPITYTLASEASEAAAAADVGTEGVCVPMSAAAKPKRRRRKK